MHTITTSVPAKAILFGEHAVNRGQTAIATSIGLRVTCRADRRGTHIQLHAAGQSSTYTRAAILALGAQIDTWRAQESYAAIQRQAAEQFFAAAAYMLAAFGAALPEALDLHFASEIPPSGGLGSGGAAFVALAAAVAHLIGANTAPRTLAAIAQRGDIVAHGGIASGLDTQTSLYGGVIRYTAERQGEPMACAPGLQLVIGHTGIAAATSVVNGRVRAWLAEHPVRLHYFREIGLLARHAEQALQQGDWPELGHLMNLNQLILERIGVSSPELEHLNEAALAAGALGAKLAGSGGGGIMIALVTPDTASAVSAAIQAAGGTPINAACAVPGVTVV